MSLMMDFIQRKVKPFLPHPVTDEPEGYVLSSPPLDSARPLIPPPAVKFELVSSTSRNMQLTGGLGARTF